MESDIAAAARSFDMGTVVHMLISSMANRSSQYVGGGAGKGYCVDDCSVAGDVLVGPLRSSVSESHCSQIKRHYID